MALINMVDTNPCRFKPKISQDLTKEQAAFTLLLQDNTHFYLKMILGLLLLENKTRPWKIAKHLTLQICLDYLGMKSLAKLCKKKSKMILSSIIKEEDHKVKGKDLSINQETQRIKFRTLIKIEKFQSTLKPKKSRKLKKLFSKK